MATQKQLRAFIQRCELDLVRDDNAAFQALISDAQVRLMLDDGDCADLFDVSRPTINRWRHGVTCPSRVVRKAVCRVLRREAKSALRKVEKATGGNNSGLHEVAMVAKPH